MTNQITESAELFKLADEKYKLGEFKEAAKYFELCFEKDPQNADLCNFIGYVYQKSDKYNTVEKQLEYFKKALEIRPNFEAAIRNLALAYAFSGKEEKALEYFEQLLKLNPLPDDFFALACNLIKLKIFELGWKFYESRFSKKFGRTEYPEFDKPRWEGQEIQDKILLVVYEQGFGDSLQFLRFLKEIKPRVGKLIFLVQDELVDLFKLNVDYAQIVSNFASKGEIEFDFHIPLMSIPSLLNWGNDEIPGEKTYIKAGKNLVEKYKKQFFQNDKIKIGLVWNGAQIGNLNRNIPLRYFYPLSKLENVELYSLQKGHGVKQLEDIPEYFKITDLGVTFNNFSDTAAAIENLDLLITSDNSVLNLAGAMGKKTFLLLGKDSEWRWLKDQETTSWYENVKIFKKQKENHDWSLLINRILEELSHNPIK